MDVNKQIFVYTTSIALQEPAWTCSNVYISIYIYICVKSRTEEKKSTATYSGRSTAHQTWNHWEGQQAAPPFCRSTTPELQLVPKSFQIEAMVIHSYGFSELTPADPQTEIETSK